MISFFRVNIPIRIAALIVLLVLIRLPLLMWGSPLIVPEVIWQLVGEKISQGSLMYRDVWDNTGPLAALVYGGIHLLFGKSQLAYQVAALVITAGHMLLFNYYMSKNDQFPEKNYLPGLIYLIVSNLFPDFLTLTPVLMANTFLLIAMNLIFRHIRIGLREDEVYLIGFLIGIATLFYLPIWIFIVLPVISFLLYTGTRPTQYLLLGFGLLLPVILTALVFFWFGEHSSFLLNYLITFLSLDTIYLASFRMLAVIFLLPVALMLMSFMQIGASLKYTHYQSVCQQVMIFWGILTVIAGYFAFYLAPYFFIVLIPAMAYFITHLFILLKKNFVKELLFATLALSTLMLLYGSAYEVGFTRDNIDSDMLFVDNTSKRAFTNKNILVLGEGADASAYVGNSLATPYLNWRLSQRHFNRLDSYSTVLTIYKNFKRSLPDVIVDNAGIVPDLFQRIPLLEQRYEKAADQTYRLKEPETP